MRRQLCFTLTLVLGLAAQTAIAQITDDFEVDSSASYTVVDESNAASGDGTPDGTILFGFDYTALTSLAGSVPPAPNSAPGETRGLVMSANNTDQDAGAADHITAYHNTSISGKYRLDVDVYLGIDSDGGTTEYAHVGVAGSTDDFNSLFLPITSGDGHFVAINGDGDSSSDYRHTTPSTGAVPSGDSTYLNPDFSTNNSAQFYQDLFPSPPFDFAGSPGNSWMELTVTVADTVTYWVNGTPIISTNTEASDGLVSLGYADLFSSVGGQFVVYDNLRVSAIPEPTTALLALAGLAGLVRRR